MAYNTFNSVYLFDFDRCSGIISFNDSVQIVPNDVDEWPVWGCSFSPNSRYLYANTNNDLYQFDTWNSSMSAGMKHIADFDGFIDFVQNYFFRHRLGPDGKIYIVPWGGSHYLHVINDPDQGDTLCNFVQHQLLLSEYAGSTLPDFPNYRLGSLPGSPCDTLTEVPDHQQVLSEIEIFPNPGNGYFNVNYLLSGDEIMELKIINLMGEVVYKKTLPQFSTRHSFDLSGLSDGVYELSIQNNKRRQSKKFVMIR